ncbi:hypothetical protein [Actinomadura parmotrematis]|uniref:Uncharacterized protein n=1 Tax=Actinomadura parmotrematis TaxID=2864039 RepID=A0ABS7FQ71_9ACTN|nr:hypothetical protein [Actinomadura parmotrematis]MBW8482527.1 hypothetical protein [Actinomadura parmotrematis]
MDVIDRSMDSYGRVRTEFYPDVVAAGGLAAAFRVRAAALGSPLGGSDAVASSAGVASMRIAAGNGIVSVALVIECRSFSVSVSAGRIQAATGTTSDLDEVVAMADAWRTGGRSMSSRGAFPS